MKTAVKIILALATVWSIFEFKYLNIYTFLRYSIGYIWAYPIKFLIIISLISSFTFLCYKVYLKEQIDLVKTTYMYAEPLLTAGVTNNADVQTIEGTVGYYKILNYLSEPINRDSSFDEQMKHIVDKGRKIYNTLPKDFKTLPNFRSSFFNFETPCLISYVDISQWNRRLIIFAKDPSVPDKTIGNSRNLNLPITLADLKPSAPAVPDLILSNIIRDHEQMAATNALQRADLIGPYRETNGSYDFLILSIAYPYENIDYNRILAAFAAIQLKK